MTPATSRLLGMRLWNGKVALLANLIVLTAASLIVYALQLVETNAFVGYLPLTFGLAYFATLLLSLAVIAVLIPTAITKPSDFFLAVYGIFVLAPYAIFHAASKPITLGTYLCTFALLLLPALLVWSMGHVKLGIAGVAAYSARTLQYLVLALCLFAALAAIRLAPPSASFGITDVYERRLEAREIFVAGSLWAYATVISANGLAPFLAFIAGLRSRFSLLIVSVALGLVFFYVIGGKAPLAYLALAYLLGIGIRRKRSGTLHQIIFVAVWIAFGAFLVEWLLTGLSLTSEFTFRRAFAGPAHVLGGYFDLTLADAFGRWSVWSGVNAPEGVTFLVGELYFGNSEENVDTNAFVHALAAGGVPEFAVATTLVCGTLWFLDAVHRATHNARLLYLGFAFSILIVEQAAGTALASSGIGLLTLLVYLSRDDQGLPSRRSDRTNAVSPMAIGSPAPSAGS